MSSSLSLSNSLIGSVLNAKIANSFSGTKPGEMILHKDDLVEVVVRGPPGGWSRGIFGSFPTDCVSFEGEGEVESNGTVEHIVPVPPIATMPLTLRPYQARVLDTAEVLNTIAFLPTGAGKTLIAVHLIKKRLHQVRASAALGQDRRQVIAFLAPTKILVGQQRRYIEAHCDAAVMEFTGDTSSVEGSSHSNVYKSSWRDVFTKAEVIVMTPEILKQFLYRKFFSVSSLDTLIIDECHHAFGSNSIVSICSFIAESGERRPIIFGMTASPIACKASAGDGGVAVRMAQLERNLHSKLLCSEEMLREFRDLVPVPTYSIHRYPGAASVSGDVANADVFKYANNAYFILDRDNVRFSKEPYCMSSHVMRTLHHAYVRTRAAAQLNEVYKMLRTAHLQPADLPELASLNLPSHEVLQRLRLGTAGVTSVDVKDAHLLFSIPGAHRFHALTELTQDIGKVLAIAEDCGILCALHALRICLNGSQDSAVDPEGGEVDPSLSLFTSTEELCGTTDLPDSGSVEVRRRRLNYVSQTDSQHMASSVDLDKISVLAEDIAVCPFSPMQLIHSEYVACVALLDVFVSLSSAMEPRVCLAAKENLKKRLSDTGSSSDENNNTQESHSQMLVQQLVCLLLDKAADKQTRLSLSVEGVLALLPAQFCAAHHSALILSVEEVMSAICDVLSAMIESITASELKQLLETDEMPDIWGDVSESDGSVTGDPPAIREKYSTVSRKVKSLYGVWLNLSSSSDSPSGIVFCRMRLAAVALSNLLVEVLSDKTVDETDHKALFITGQMKQQDQLKALQRFRSGDCNVLFATDVVEEGLDVRVCQYVIHFDLPATVKSFIQRRGRARASNSAIIALVPEGVEGERMVRDLQTFSDQEREMEVYAQRSAVIGEVAVTGRGVTDEEKLELVDLLKVMEAVIEFRAHSGDERMVLEEGEEVEFVRTDTEKAIVIPLNDERYVVPSTGVQVDVRTSAQLVLQFCQMLPHDTYYSPRPIFWMSTLKEPTSAGGKPQLLFRCSILLPPALTPHCRFVVGSPSENKATAKGLASLACIKMLHQAGELNDHLMTNGSKQADRVERSTQLTLDAKAEELGSEKQSDPLTETVGVKRDRLEDAFDEPTPAASGGPTAEAEVATPKKMKKKRPATPPPDADILRILVKTVPDCLTLPPVESGRGDETVDLYLYAVRCDFIDDQTRDITMDCPSCSTNFKAINEFGIAFTSKLPSDVFQSVFDCNLRESECLVIKMELLEHKQISKRELFHMQRFHRAVLCSESECKRYRRPEFEPNQHDSTAYAGIPDEIWLSPEADLSQFSEASCSEEDQKEGEDCSRRLREVPVDHDSWRASANGAWYCIFPLPEDVYVRDHQRPSGPAAESLFRVRINEDPLCTFHHSEKWYQYLKQSADEAHILLHNLRMQESLNRQDLDEFYPPFLDQADKVHQMSGMLVSRGSGGVFWVGDQDSEPELQKSLSSVIKFVRPDHPENVAITTFTPMADARATPRLSNVYQEMMQEEEEQQKGMIGASKDAAPVPPEQSLVPMTFADHFLQKYPKYAAIIRQMEKDPSQRLVKVQQITSRLTLTYLLGRSYNNKLENKRQELSDMTSYSPFIPVQPPRKVHVRVRKAHSHCSPIYLVPDFCRPLGKVKWMSIGAVAPSIIWRIQSLLHSVEARMKIASVLDEFSASSEGTTVVVTGNSGVGDITPCGTTSGGQSAPVLVLPRASIMLEALTPRLAKENLDSERLELLGDSLLKLVTTDELFRIYPNKHEGFLTSQRAKIISNMHLTEMCLKLGLDRYLRGFPLSTGKQQLLVRPPGISLRAIQQGLSLWNGNLIVKKGWGCGGGFDAEDGDEPEGNYRPASKRLASLSAAGNQKPVKPVSEEAALEAAHDKTDLQLARQHNTPEAFFKALFPVAQCESAQVKAKALADVMEAIIGGFYVEGGLRSGVAAIKALGAWPKLDVNLGGEKKNAAAAAFEAGLEENELMKCDETVSATSAVGGGRVPEVVFPDNFPEALKRIALGHTIDITVKSSESAVSEDLFDSDNVQQINSSRRSLWSNRQGAAAAAVGVSKPVVDAITLAIGYTFRNWSLLDEALTHGSVQHKRSNQRLEFLGDAVLDFAVVSLLFKHQPWAKQGDLSAQKSAATNNKNLGQFGARLQLYRYLNLSSDLLEEEFLKLDTLMNGEDFSNTLKYNSSGEEPAAKRQKTDSESRSDGVEGESSGQCGRASPAVESFLHGFTTSSEGLNAEPMAEEKLRAITACIRSPKVIPMGAGTTKTLADTFEALMAAVYLDSGGDMEVVSSVVRYINLLPQLA